jgi:hypothetical protein
VTRFRPRALPNPLSQLEPSPSRPPQVTVSPGTGRKLRQRPPACRGHAQFEHFETTHGDWDIHVYDIASKAVVATTDTRGRESECHVTKRQREPAGPIPPARVEF